MIEKRIQALRSAMKASGIDCYVIPTCDYHNSEYVSEYFMARKYFSGFTGSAGVLVVFADQAALFTDGRYFIQAEQELKGSNIILMKTGEPDVPALTEYIEQELKEGQTLGFDGRVITAGEGKKYEAIAQKKKGNLSWNHDLADRVWEDRPALKHSRVFLLEEGICGESTEGKLERLRNRMKEEGTGIHLLTTLDDIAWLFNIRANDVESCPVVLAYAVITMTEAILFADRESFQEKEAAYLSDHQIRLMEYNDFYTYAAELIRKNPREKLLVYEKRINYRLKKEIGEAARVIDKPNPTMLFKAVKNKTEQENLRKAHLMDALAVTRFMYWLKTNAGKIPMTEISAAEYLEDLRRENESFIEPSFETICAYREHGAIIHYSASPKECAEIEAEGLLMVDSGGHYLEGSTDITRTFVLGKITDEMKAHFTLVVRSMLNLKNAKFLYGCKGVNLDILARQVFWEKGLDYKHGTGHGVGYLLNVHEGPNSFRWKPLADSEEDWVFEEGMVTTDEPGIYREGSHGIRIENELLCQKDEKNESGQFMRFEDLTYVPIDLDGIHAAAMENRERALLNSYHKEVFEKLSPFFEGKELEWLRHSTREI